MTRKKLILVAGTCAVAVAIGSPAYALNPQPLPPGYQSHTGTKFVATGRTTTVFCANGNHIRR